MDMYALIMICIALAVLVILLELGIQIGQAMMASALVLGVLLGVTPALLAARLATEWRDLNLTETTPYLFVALTGLLLLVNVFGEAMNQIGLSARLIPAMEGLFRSRRVALAAIPLLMGLLPTPGGIMLSAPMVRQAGDRIGVERSRLAAINFFFRHQWEPVWPLFPALPLIVDMVQVPASSVAMYHLSLSITGMISGALALLLVGIPPRHSRQIPADVSWLSYAKDLFHALWPILFTAGLYLRYHMPPAIGLLVAIFGLLIIHRLAPRRWPSIFRAALEPDTVLLILGAMWFKLNLEASGAVGSVVSFFAQIHMPPLLVLLVLPLLVGFCTGVTAPTVAITYPFLLPLIRTGERASLGLETLAFAGIMFGLAISPIHLCLALSASYFDRPLLRIVLKVLPPALCIVAAGLIVALLSS